MGTVIRLTESQLKKVISRIINETEMSDMSMDSTMSSIPKGMCKTSMAQLLKDTHNFTDAPDDAEYYKRFYPKGVFVVKGGEAFEPTPGGGTSNIRKAFNINKTILMKEGGRLDVEFKTNGMGAAGDSFTLICRGGKVMVKLTSDVRGGA